MLTRRTVIYLTRMQYVELLAHDKHSDRWFNLLSHFTNKTTEYLKERMRNVYEGDSPYLWTRALEEEDEWKRLNEPDGQHMVYLVYPVPNFCGGMVEEIG